MEDVWTVPMGHYLRFFIALGVAISADMRPLVNDKNIVPPFGEHACDYSATKPSANYAKI